MTPSTSYDSLRPTQLKVDLDQLERNLAWVRDRVGTARVLAVLKANAYGHGLLPLARLYEQLGVAYLGVAYLEEGLVLRKGGVQCPILVMGGLVGARIPAFIEHDLTLTASSVPKLRAIDACARQLGRTARVHLKVDTGMERIGVHWYSYEPLIQAALQCTSVHIEGMYSHLANAEGPHFEHAHEQIARFNEVLELCAKHGLRPPLRHLANSGGVLHLPQSHYDLVRPGLLLYGYDPSGRLLDGPTSALTWRSQVVYFKVVQAGSPISYGSTYRPDRMTRVVTVPVGYGDGYSRRMSGRAQVVIRGRRYPVVGRICMDQVMVDIGWDTAYNDDEVTLLGGAGTERITLGELAAWSDTNAYEALTTINTRVPRVYTGVWAERLGL